MVFKKALTLFFFLSLVPYFLAAQDSLRPDTLFKKRVLIEDDPVVSMLDSLANLIRKDSIKFDKAAIRFSTHKDSRINGGKLVSANPSSRITWFTLEELNHEMYVKVREMKVGEISDAFKTTDENNNEVFRIVKLDNVLPAHAANLKDDYQNIYDAALVKERAEVFDKWVKNKIGITYIKISDELKSCDFLQTGWLK